MPLLKSRKSLGVAHGKRRYDLPLGKGTGTGFLILLIALMTFLATLALAASFAMSAMTERWSSGLENRVTVEIPAESKDGTLMKPEQIEALTTRIGSLLGNHPSVKNIHILSEDEIQDLVKPWLGEDLLLNKIPLPGLISVELQESNPETLKTLSLKVRNIAPQARLDTHESWLKDLLRFTGALQFAATLLTIVIGITTATAIAGAVRARMAVHHAEVELLHLMGASDNYIATQFQRHSMILALQGGISGVAAGALSLLVIGGISGEMDVNLLPGFKLGTGQILTLMILPVIAGIIAILSARKTVLHVLARMT